ncbi:putative nucleotidyltransferase substrate binding domain-containing protein [Magnetovibrio sp. PR-2]|uniref:putative nucleotidyltransferase substrate binding domain-containing protein n=1 Tax=Magnetovibrio sp. PR-2 TaxID=3120356 RepID=UPI002FCE643F
MDVELLEIRDFLIQHHPFDLLPEDAIEHILDKIESSYTRRDQSVLEIGAPCEHLYIVRTGSVETRTQEDEILARLSEGECFGVHAMLNPDRVVVNRAMALEDSLFYMLPADEFEYLRNHYKQFAYFFAPLGAERLRGANTHGSSTDDAQLGFISTKIGELLQRDPITIELDCDVRTAALVMRDMNVSSLLVCDDNGLAGIVTERDLRNRVVAEALPVDSPIEKIMTPNPITLDAKAMAFDAMMIMSKNNIRHLPIVKDGDNVVGVITNSSLVQHQSTSAVYMVGDIHKRDTFDGIAEVVGRVPQLLCSLVEAGATAHTVGHVISSIADAATTRLLKMGEDKFGPPPVPYLWCASGSQARFEQTCVGDQDNCMVISDDFDEDKHGGYFKMLANYVNEGLNAANYVYCPGDIMAKTDEWRQPVSVWKSYFTKWIEMPEPKALMLSSIFFDLRGIWGDISLIEPLQDIITEKAPKHRLFIGHMVGNALSHTPPLGFFKNFVLIHDGEHDDTFDMKHNGVVPIVDIARIVALEGKITTSNTFDRLETETQGKVLSPSGKRDLVDAYEFIATARLEHQVKQIRRGDAPDNFMKPEELSHFERNHLRDAFSVIKTIQSAMANAHGG